MTTVEHLSPIEASKALPWQQYLLDSVLAFVGAMLVTGVIYAFQIFSLSGTVFVGWALL